MKLKNNIDYKKDKKNDYSQPDLTRQTLNSGHETDMIL